MANFATRSLSIFLMAPFLWTGLALSSLADENQGGAGISKSNEQPVPSPAIGGNGTSGPNAIPGTTPGVSPNGSFPSSENGKSGGIPWPTAIPLPNQVVPQGVDSGSGSSTGAGTSSAATAGDGGTRRKFTPKPLPPEPVMSHDENKRLNMGPFKLSTYIAVSALKPMKLDASYNQPLSLREALAYAMQNNLPIKISRESWNYQKYQFAGSIISALPIPSMSMGYNQTWSNILSSRTTSNASVFSNAFRFPLFQGGSQVYGMLAQYYRQAGWHSAYNAGVDDALLDVYNRYVNLVLQNTLLQIRAKSLQVSEAQLALNNTMYAAGNGTQFAIMQSRTQLATDRQAMQQQQVAVRQAALNLAFSLNLPMSINLVPRESDISEQSIFDETIPIDTLLDIALVRRPELRQYELYKLAQNRNVQVAASSLYPTFSFVTSYTHSETDVSPPGGNAGVFLNSIAAANLANSTGGGCSGSGSGGSSGSNTEGAGVFGGLFNTYEAGYNLSWGLTDMGLQSVVNIISTRALARQGQLQANQELLLITQQVRMAYLTALTSREQIDNAAYGAISSREALRLAELRLRSGMGTNLELITAQREYINALTSQAQAIVASNQAQAQILHDVGVISVESLTDGFDLKGELMKEKNSRKKKQP